MAQNIRGSSLPLPDTEPMSGEGEKGISVGLTARSQKIDDHMRKSPVSPRKGRDERVRNSKKNDRSRRRSISPDRSTSRRDARGRSRERRHHNKDNRRACRKGAAGPTEGSPRRVSSRKRTKSRTASPSKSPPVRNKESPLRREIIDPAGVLGLLTNHPPNHLQR